MKDKRLLLHRIDQTAESRMFALDKVSGKTKPDR